MQNTTKIKEIVLRQRSEAKDMLKERFVEREADLNNSLLKSSLIKVILGPRRAGKSFFSIQSMRNRSFAYINFDEEELVKVDDYDLFLKSLREVYGNYEFLVLDEIQNLEKWELFVNRLQRNRYNLVVTGSNSKLLSKELATHLTGRHLPVMIFQFSFREFLKARDVGFSKDDILSKENQGDILGNLRKYMEIGGFPEIVVKNLDYRSYTRTLFNNIVFKDVVKRYNIRYASKIYELGKYMINLFSKEFSFTKAKNILGLGSVHTVENYAGYLEEAFIFVMINKFSPKPKEQIKAPKKIYVIDNGFIGSMAFRISENFGKLMENTVAIELVRRSDLFSGFEIFYWKDYQQNEVDFIIKEGLKIKQLVQVTYASGKEDLEKRETRSLLKAAKELRCKNLLVITWDYEAEEKVDGKKVKFIPLWKWLLLDKTTKINTKQMNH